MLKRVDNRRLRRLDGRRRTWKPAPWSLGLAEDGVGYALDENNEDLVTDEMKAAVDEATPEIIDGEIEVHDYTPTTAARR